MRIGIREQLGLLVLLSTLVSLAVISIAVWIENEHYVLSITSRGLSLTASLKAAQVNSNLVLIQSTCALIVTRILIQESLKDFYAGNTSDSNWIQAQEDTESALATSSGTTNLLQIKMFPRNNTGNIHGLINTTSDTDIVLPYTHPNNNSFVHLGDVELGYPPALYPNLTYVPTDQPDPTDPSTNLTLVEAFSQFQINITSPPLFLGPLQINSTTALVSITLPIINNTSSTDVLGYMTIVAATPILFGVMSSRLGLANTGTVLLVGPTRASNRFPDTDRPMSSMFRGNRTTLGDESVRYIFPPTPPEGVSNRHNLYNGSFALKKYPAVLDAYEHNSSENASSNLSAKNEQGVSVSVGYAWPISPLVDWMLIVEQQHSEAWEPITKLRNILLACVFGTTGVILLLIFPIAHYSVRPIRRLRDATEKSIQPPGYTPAASLHSEDEDRRDGISGDEEQASPLSGRSKNGNRFYVALRKIRHSRRKSRVERTEDERRRVFKIPGKVQDRKHFITDELTELTGTFNEMSDELMMQYSRLEERVAERTKELEISKKAAEAANESKTLFIANISHELKTPLNGILGMCAVCMGEDDLPRIKRSLQVVYKSGDLLLNLLNDLLTFSKNQIGQQLSLEEKEFRLHDIRTQITTIFDKQVRDGRIDFAVLFLSTEEPNQDQRLEKPLEKPLPALGPNGTGRLKDMSLWGDQHRILQVIINLVSNSLKFTPEGGRVQVRIKCVGEKEKSNESSRAGSMGSKQSSQRLSKNRSRGGSGSGNSTTSRVPSSSKPTATALVINPMDPKIAPHVQVYERTQTPPPANARTLIFEFEVEDSGPGIPEAMQQRVFEPFVQGDLGLSKKYGGTGLGLSICSQLAGLMGGSISLKSTVGVGTTFNMRIPLKFVKQRAASTASSDVPKDDPSRPSSVLSHTRSVPTTDIAPASGGIGFDKDAQPRLVGLSQPFFASPAPSPAVSAPRGSSEEHLTSTGIFPAGSSTGIHAAAARKEGKIRVLVAEDNLVNQEVVLRMLKLEDIYDVTVAKDGQEAFDTVKAVMDEGKRFDLIFMDIQMPNLDGLQSTRLIRQMGYSAPIVALTAFADESNVKQCMDSGMDMFLSKPIRRPALKQVLQKFATIEEEGEISPQTNSPQSPSWKNPVMTKGLATPASAPQAPQGESSSIAPPIPDAGLEKGVEKEAE